jgi:type II secretory ATPase GspE/PulE/Tfp pilus assembly ATPase PilB-like protein
MSAQTFANASTVIPARYARKYSVVPLSLDNGVLHVAYPEEAGDELLEELALLLGLEVTGERQAARPLSALLQRTYGVGADAIDSLNANGTETMPDEEAVRASTGYVQRELVDDMADDASIVSVVNELLLRAEQEGATDIHLEPLEDRVRVRFRIDGMLLEIAVPEGLVRYHAVVVSRIKVMANLDIAERRLPQDGRIKATVGGVQHEYRVSILPTQFGETVDIRVLTNTSILTGLDGLGMWEKEQAFIRRTLEVPYGVVLVTGPTGSGKTTSLYSFLNLLNETSRKIITIEDPIEYHLDGITQIQVHPRIGLSFAAGLRSMLRHDPDVMMVGEIRDHETAETVIRVALTGHLVFSTVHTNDAPSTPARLLNMGVEPYLLASSVRAILAQRLVRKICPACRRDDDSGYAREMSAQLPEAVRAVAGEIRFQTGAGCDRCHQTGYSGRTAIFEILPVSGALQDLILSRAPASKLREEMARRGGLTLRERGLALAARGETSVSEVLRVTADDDRVGLDLPIAENDR